ncbi:uncharacterized protein TNCV_2173881 [Trichonephila clavipes]|nr:uncharacterized protein TNCV_2173881 [Trichonephila clavipes]
MEAEYIRVSIYGPWFGCGRGSQVITGRHITGSNPSATEGDVKSAEAQCPPVGMMAFAAKNQTNPVTIAATGYKPYIEARAFRASQKKGVALSKAERNAQKIRDYWAQQDVSHQIKDYAESHEKTLFRNRWECAADKKSLYSRVQWQMDKITSKMDEDLDRRRNRLTDLLRNEEDMLLKESLSQEEDEESKHARMFSRYTKLKMQKEADRQKVAEEKKEQQFSLTTIVGYKSYHTPRHRIKEALDVSLGYSSFHAASIYCQNWPGGAAGGVSRASRCASMNHTFSIGDSSGKQLPVKGKRSNGCLADIPLCCKHRRFVRADTE